MADQPASNTDRTLPECLLRLLRHADEISTIEPILDGLLDIIQLRFQKVKNDLERLESFIDALAIHEGLLAEWSEELHEVLVSQRSALRDHHPVFDEALADLQAFYAEQESYRLQFNSWRWTELIVYRLGHALRRADHGDDGAIAQFTREYEQLDALRGRLEAVPRFFSTDHFAALYQDLKEAPDLDEVLDEFNELEQDMKVEEEKRQHYRQKLAQYRWSGYLVTPLENALRQDLATVERAFDQFERSYRRMRTLRDRLAKLDVRGFQSDLESIYHKMYDLSKLDDVRTELKRLEKKIWDRDE